jgi:hypothetical protein
VWRGQARESPRSQGKPGVPGMPNHNRLWLVAITRGKTAYTFCTLEWSSLTNRNAPLNTTTPHRVQHTRHVTQQHAPTELQYMTA